MRTDKAARALCYPSSEIFLVVVSALLLAAAQIRMFFSSSPKILKALQTPGKPSPFLFFLKNFSSVKKTRLVSLVEACDANLGWKPSCLRRTLTLSAILRAMGFHPELKIGVNVNSGSFSAHSWFEMDGIRLEIKNDGIPFTQLLPAAP